MNIFENAKFGDKFRTRDGRMVLFNSPTSFYKGWYWMIAQGSGTCRYFEDGLLNIGEENSLDIVGKWEEPINEEELDRLALEHSEPIDTIPDDWFNKRRVKLLVRSAYEAGYRKAKGE